MRIDIQSRGFTLTAPLREHVRRRLSFELGWAADKIATVTVRLSDLNGPRGGSDKRCRIRIDVPSASVVVEDVEGDLYFAIGRAADRARRALQRRIARRNHHRKGALPAAAQPANMPAYLPSPVPSAGGFVH